MFRTSGWRCCCPVKKSSGGGKKIKILFCSRDLLSAEKCSIFDTQVTPLLLCAQKWRMSGRLQVCYIFLLFGLQFLYGSVICHLEEIFFLLSCAVILHFSPVDMRSCKEQAHLYIGSDIPGDKCPCFVLWLCKIMCACATFCPGVISRLAYLMKFPLQVSLFIVSELSVMIGAFWTVVCSSTLQRVLCFKSRRSTLTALINVGLNSNLVSSK